MKLTSSEFDHGRPLPRRYSGEGEDLSPALNWSRAPEGTHSFALVCEDLDAVGPHGQPFVHWLVYGISSRISSLPEGIAPSAKIGAPIALAQGRNDFGRVGYGGPLPPSGTHRYLFTLYALDADLGLRPGATRAELAAAVRGHVLEQAGIKATYHSEPVFRSTLGEALRNRATPERQIFPG